MWFEEIRRRLQAATARDLPDEAPGREAAVLVPLFVEDGALRVLLTVRSDRVEHHKGQVSFPGGSREGEDEDLVSTALRETEEEVGIDRSRILVLGRLDECLSVTGFRVTPFVAAIPFPDRWTPDPEELDELMPVDLARFLDPGVKEERDVEWQGLRRKALFYQVGKVPVWGLTARIIEEFLAVLGSNGVPGAGRRMTDGNQ